MDNSFFSGLGWQTALKLAIVCANLYNRDCAPAQNTGNPTRNSMKVFQRFYRYINPKIDPDVQHHMDRYSMRSIYYASIAVFVVETLLFLYALLTNLGSMNQSVISSLISVGSCVVMCFIASLLSSWSLRK